MGIPWDGTGINCYGMGQINMSHGQPCSFRIILGVSFVVLNFVKANGLDKTGVFIKCMRH